MKLSILLALCCSLLFAACSRFSKQNAGLAVTSNVSSTVFMDGEEVGNTPYKSGKLAAKKYTIRLTPSDTTYQAHEAVVKLTSGFEALIDWKFATTKEESSGVIFQIDTAADRNKSELEIFASPDNVPVSIDGEAKGFTPLLIDDLTEGKHTMTLQAPGYDPMERDIIVVKGKRLTVTAKLARRQPTIDTATASAVLSTQTATHSATPSATKKPTVTARPTVRPATSSATTATPSATTSQAVKRTTTTKPYVRILETPTGFLRVRASSSSTATEIGKLLQDSTVPYLNASASGWLKVEHTPGASGWVSSQYAQVVQ